jgi:hypothetical protein
VQVKIANPRAKVRRMTNSLYRYALLGNMPTVTLWSVTVIAGNLAPVWGQWPAMLGCTYAPFSRFCDFLVDDCVGWMWIGSDAGSEHGDEIGDAGSDSGTYRNCSCGCTGDRDCDGSGYCDARTGGCGSLEFDYRRAKDDLCSWVGDEWAVGPAWAFGTGIGSGEASVVGRGGG